MDKKIMQELADRVIKNISFDLWLDKQMKNELVSYSKGQLRIRKKGNNLKELKEIIGSDSKWEQKRD